MPAALAPRAIRTIATALLIGVAVAVLAASPATAATTDERDLFNATNADRAANGLAPLSYDSAASDVARSWAQRMASAGLISHNPNLSAEVNAYVTSSWTRIGENVGVGWDAAGLERAFMASPGHRANIVGPYNRVGVGSVRSADGRLWVVVVFVQGPAISSAFPYIAPPPPSGAAWYLREALSTGVADRSLSYGMASDQTITCDWNGDGVDTVAVYRSGTFYLRDSLTSGVADRTVGYGMPGDTPVCGDWNGDGTDTIGIYRNGAFYIRDTNTTGGADRVIGYGMAGDRPLIGDWNGDGIETIGIHRRDAFYLRDSLTTGTADRVVGYGIPGDRPLIGDWNGDGIDTIGIHRNGAFYLRDSNTSGIADLSFIYGNPTDVPLVGDWNADGDDSAGIVRQV